MEQKKLYRENFWNNSGEVYTEMQNFFESTERKGDAEWSVLDAWFSLFCC